MKQPGNNFGSFNYWFSTTELIIPVWNLMYNTFNKIFVITQHFNIKKHLKLVFYIYLFEPNSAWYLRYGCFYKPSKKNVCKAIHFIKQYAYWKLALIKSYKFFLCEKHKLDVIFPDCAPSTHFPSYFTLEKVKPKLITWWCMRVVKVICGMIWFKERSFYQTNT